MGPGDQRQDQYRNPYLPLGVGGSSANEGQRNTMIDWTTPLFEEGIFKQVNPLEEYYNTAQQNMAPTDDYYAALMQDVFARFAARAQREGFTPAEQRPTIQF